MEISTIVTIIGSIVLSLTTLISAILAYRKIKFEIANMKANEKDIYATAAEKLIKSSGMVLDQLKERVSCLETENEEKNVLYKKLEDEYELLRKDHISLRNDYFKLNSEHKDLSDKLITLTKENILYRKWNTILMAQVIELEGIPAPMPRGED